MKKEKENNYRFYILISILIILTFVITFFNYMMEKTIIIPKLDTATYENILKHMKMLKMKKKYT